MSINWTTTESQLLALRRMVRQHQEAKDYPEELVQGLWDVLLVIETLVDDRDRRAKRAEGILSQERGEYLKCAARVAELTRQSDDWQEVARNENGRRKAAEARVTELEAATLSFVEGVSFTDHHVRRMREFSVLVDALATERGETP